jgi:hypothetical protein
MKQWVALLRNLPPQASVQGASSGRGGVRARAHWGASISRCLMVHCNSYGILPGHCWRADARICASLATAPAACSCGQCPAAALSSGASRPRVRCPRKASASSCSRQARRPASAVAAAEATMPAGASLALHRTPLHLPAAPVCLAHHSLVALCPPIPFSLRLHLRMHFAAVPEHFCHPLGACSLCRGPLRLLPRHSPADALLQLHRWAMRLCGCV